MGKTRKISGPRPEWATLYGRLAWLVETYADGNISQASEALGWDRKQLGVQLARAAKGGELSVRSLRTIRDHFGLTWDWLLDGEGVPTVVPGERETQNVETQATVATHEHAPRLSVPPRR